MTAEDIRRLINPYVSDLLKFYKGLSLAESLFLVCIWRGEISVLVFGREHHSWVKEKEEGLQKLKERRHMYVISVFCPV